MSRTLEIARQGKPRHPLVFIPGFLGSKLRNPRTGQVLWGNMSNILTHNHRDRLACSLDPVDTGGQEELEAFALYESLWGVEYYRKTLHILKQAGGYQLGDIAHPAPGDNAFVFVYDWRKDIAETTGLFAQAMERLQDSLGSDVTFDIVAHSQGGLIARYYALYGGRDVLDDEGGQPVPDGAGAARLNKVILVGTPNQGTLEAMKILHLGLKKGFMPMDPSVTFTMPALYQMLPPPASVRFASLDGTPVQMDLYDPDTWQREKFSVFSPATQDEIARKIRLRGGGPAEIMERNAEYRNFLQRQLARARRFQSAVAARPAGKAPAFYAFGSDCVPTLKSAVAIEEKGERKIYFDQGRYRRDPVGDRMDKILYGAGDGTVLMESLLALPEILEGEEPAGPPGSLALSSAFFVCDSHGLLTNNPIFQNNLLYLLLYERGDAGLPPPAMALDDWQTGQRVKDAR